LLDVVLTQEEIRDEDKAASTLTLLKRAQAATRHGCFGAALS
jgi:hypothetical protein